LRKALLFCLLSILFLSYGTSALADFQLRAHSGPLNGEPTSFNKAFDSTVTNHPDIEKVSLLGADALYVVPIFPFVFGLRYEQWSAKNSGDIVASSLAGKAEVNFKGSRTSLLLGYRLLSLPILYVGLLGHYGISQNMQYSRDLTFSGVTTSSTYGVGVGSSYGAGLEAGVTLGGLLVGAEVGYTSLKSNTVVDSNGTALRENGNDVIVDLSGTYMKIMLGLSI
jgi:hypothetical protein